MSEDSLEDGRVLDLGVGRTGDEPRYLGHVSRWVLHGGCD